MTRLALALALTLLASPALAAGDAGPPVREPQGRPVVRVEAILSRVDLGGGDMGQVLALWSTPILGTCDSAHRDCGDWWTGPGDDGGPEPAPIPLPGTFFYLAAGLAALALKRKHYV